MNLIVYTRVFGSGGFSMVNMRSFQICLPCATENLAVYKKKENPISIRTLGTIRQWRFHLGTLVVSISYSLHSADFVKEYLQKLKSLLKHRVINVFHKMSKSCRDTIYFLVSFFSQSLFNTRFFFYKNR